MNSRYCIGCDKNELDTPALWVDLDIMERNIAKMAQFIHAAGVAWRPHTKGIKIPAIAHKLIAAGAIGVTCAKLGEAEVMAAAGIQDILIASQVVGKAKTTRLANLCHHADVIVAVDSSRKCAPAIRGSLPGWCSNPGCGGSQHRHGSLWRATRRKRGGAGDADR